jgi:hypothetical protein
MKLRSSSNLVSSHRPRPVESCDTSFVCFPSASSSPKYAAYIRRYRRTRSFYERTRALLAHPADSTMCKYCGVREHTALHHEDDFKRNGTVGNSHLHALCNRGKVSGFSTLFSPFDLSTDTLQIRHPSGLTAPELAAEVKRCTREDGSIGLVSVCAACHHQKARRQCTSSERWMKAMARNKILDIAAKLARGECECDDECHRPVTEEDVDLFEWDHLVQSFDDPSYRRVSRLVNSASSTARCNRERAKCRLLYVKCHYAHSVKQRARRRVALKFLVSLR